MHLVWLLTVLCLCVPLSAKVIEPDDTNPYFRIHTLDDHPDEKKFLREVLPELVAFVRYSLEAGFTLPTPLPIYLAPVAGQPPIGSAADYYGEGITEAFTESLNALAGSPPRSVVDVCVRKLEASYPGFFSRSPLDWDTYRPSLNDPSQASYVRQRIERAIREQSARPFTVPPQRSAR